jgi:4-amino-4-deoxy-L-arabinose transferase-like glycosyltransferase
MPSAAIVGHQEDKGMFRRLSICAKRGQAPFVRSTLRAFHANGACPLFAQMLNTRPGHHALLVVVGLLMFTLNLGGPSLWDVDEGRNSTAALEMMASGDWIVPTFNGEVRDHKPALLYWLQVAAFHLFGVNEFAARLPSALASLVTLLLIYELGRALFNKSTGLLAGLVAATTVMLCVAARFANPDALLNLGTVLALTLFWRGYARTGRFPYFAFGLGCGLALLAKGPVGFVLPDAALLVFLFWVGRLRIALTPRFFLGVLSCALVALPWYALVGVETKTHFLRGFLYRHNVERFLGSMESHDGGPLFYPVVLMVGFAPWSAFFGLTLWYSFWSAVRSPWRRCHGWWAAARDSAACGVAPEDSPGRKRPNQMARSSTHDPTESYRFLWSWIVVYLVFFTLAATKLPNYILPVSTPLAILTARLLDRWRRGTLMAPAWGLGLGLACFALVGVVAAAGMVVLGTGVAAARLSIPVFAGLEWWGALGGVLVVGAALAAWCWRQQRYRGAVPACLTLAAVLFLAPLLAWGAAIIDQFKPARGLVARSEALQPAHDIRILNYKVEHLASLHFYVQRGVEYCGSDHQVLDTLRLPVPVYLFVPRADWDRLSPLVQVPCRVLGRHKDLHQHVGEVVVVANDRAP